MDSMFSEIMWVIFLKTVFMLLMVIISVAFLTLMERKSLALIQIRKGPSKIGYNGLFQPFSDAVKLLMKEEFIPQSSVSFVFLISPIISFCLVMMMWLSQPSYFGISIIWISLVYLLCCLSLGVYPLVYSGWSSNSKYSQIGSIRALAQSISYEVSLAFSVLSLGMLISSLSSMELLNMKMWFILFSPILSCMWMMIFLAEANRSPFDFAEAESELVSGFNTEYSSSGFVLFFLAEYSSILFFSFFLSFFFLNSVQFVVGLSVMGVLMSFLMIWVRGTLPRFRYDMLMDLAWKVFLPSVILLLFYSFGVSLMSWI